MKNCLLNIDIFNKIFYKSDLLKGCFFCFLFSIVKHFSKNIDLFLLNDIYFYTDAEGTDRLSLISKSNIDWMDIANELHIELDARIYCEDLAEEMRSAIQNQRPVIVSADGFYLPFATSEGHIPRYILVEGYDKENDLFNIVVQKKRNDTFYVKDTISGQQLKLAYEGYMVRYNTIYKIDEGKDYPTYFTFMNKEDFNPDIQSAIIRYKKYINMNLEVINKGLDRMNKFITQVTERHIDIDYTKFIEDVNNIISIMRVQLYAFKTCIMNEQIIENILNELIAEWEKVRFILVRSDTKGIQKNKMTEMVLDKLNSIMILEKVYCEELEQFSKKAG